MNDINIADALQIVAEIRGDADALIQGDRTLSWREVERRTRNVAAWMKASGAGHQAKVSIYSYNAPAYMESVAAAFRAALVPANVNYRYREEELRYLLDNSDSEIVVVHEDFVPLLRAVVSDLPKIRAVAVVAESGEADLSDLPGAAWYEDVAETDLPDPGVERSGDDMLFLYTGGTTGMPKGVMWRQGDLFSRFGGGGISPGPDTLPEYRALVEAQIGQSRLLIGPPLMHGTGWFTSLIGWLSGGTVLLLTDPKRFDAAEMLQIIGDKGVTGVTIVGDPFCKPIVKELQARPDAYDISTVALMMSSGVMWSQESKQGLLAVNPKMLLIDSLGSSEAIGMGASTTTAAGTVNTGKFSITPSTRLFTADLEILESKPGAKGMIGVGGPQPIGYYKDPEKSAKTFVEAEGQRFSIPGDWALIEDDGVSLALLGRGSVCINTGGEKVFPEEVEEAIKRFEGIRDAVVVGVPDEKWGEAITAVVSTHSPDLDEKALRESVKSQLASYKCPKFVVHVEAVYRSPSGKADFKRTRETAMEALGMQDG
jgi:acyl-CoA synthetase (AMP-forming)/AMP-acid ligase II